MNKRMCPARAMLHPDPASMRTCSVGTPMKTMAHGIEDTTVGLELVDPQHGSAIDQCPVNGYQQPMDMKDGQGMDQNIVRTPTPMVARHLGVPEHVAMREHGAHASARRPPVSMRTARSSTALYASWCRSMWCVARTSKLPLRPPPNVNTRLVPAEKLSLVIQPK